MRKVLLLLFTITLYSSLSAQQIDACEDPGSFVLTGDCSEACVLCDLDGFTTSNSNPDAGVAPDGFCATALHNLQWVGFVAGSEDITLEFVVFNCSGIDDDGNMISDGLQVGIYNTTDCNSYQEAMPCNGQIQDNETATFTNTDPLIVGGIYFLVVDGFNGDICDFTVNVLSGSTEAPIVEQVEPQISTSALSNIICPSGTLTASVEPLIEGAGAYIWTLDGVEVATDAVSMIEMPNFEATLELCVTAYNPCSQGLTNCVDIMVENLEDVIYDVTICDGESYYWPPSGVAYFNSINNVALLDNNDCSQVHRLFLTVQDEADVTELEETVCEGESITITNPYTSEDFTFSTSGNHVAMLTNQFDCDSIVELDLTVLSNTSANESVTLCPGDSYTVSDFAGFSETISAANTYNYTLEGSNGCDSTLTLTLDLEDVPDPIVENVTICEGESYTFNGTSYSNAGIYNDLFTTGPPLNCPYSGTLELAVHTPEFSFSATICEGEEVVINGESFDQTGDFTIIIPNGSYLLCDSIVMLDLTVEPSSITDEDAEICEGEEYEVNGEFFTETGDYEIIVGAGAMCDEIINLHLIVHPTYETDEEGEFCFGQFYEYAGDIFDQPGEYSLEFQTEAGCDSIVNLTLTMTDEIYEIQTVRICDSETYPVGNQDYDTAGTYEIFLEAADGCDSIILLDLTVDPTYAITVDESICAGQVYAFDGNNLDQSGTYMATFQASNSCDSVVTLNLTVAPPAVTDLDIQICSGQSYTVGMETFDASGNYDIVITAPGACDSTVHLNLLVTNMIEEDLVVEICNNQTYTVGMTTFDATGNYDIPLTSVAGCDSIVHLDLTVSDVLLAMEDQTICEGDTVFVDNMPLTTSGAFPFDYVTTDGCDSTYTLNLTVLPASFTTLNPVICSGTTFEAGGMSFDQAGNYDLVLQAANTCDSFLTINLTIDDQLFFGEAISICDGTSITVDGTVLDATGVYDFPFVTPEGCDSIYQVDLTILPPLETTITPTICEGSSFMIGDSTFTMAGNYLVPLASAGGCDSVVTVQLGITNTVTTPLAQVICEGDSAFINTIPYLTTGMYEETFITASGCDSIVQLDLTVNPTAAQTLNPVICEGETFEAGGQSFNATGNYEVIVPATNLCDSVISVNLTVNPSPQVTINPSICTGQTFEIGGQSFDETGIYEVILQTAELCDSTVTVNLTVSTVIIEMESVTICEGDSVMVGTSVYNMTGNYEDDFITADGCDSLYQLDLTVIPTTFATIDPLICAGESFDIGTSSFVATGTYEETILSAAGCDSVVTVNLTVAPNPQIMQAVSICESGSYTVGDSTMTDAGVYEILLVSSLGCDSTVTVDLSIADFYQSDLPIAICEGESYLFDGTEYTDQGDYPVTFTAQDGCDSIVNLLLTVNPLLTESIVAVVCEGESVTIGGVAYSTTGIHQETVPSLITMCDSTITLDLTVHPVYTINLDDTICEGEAVMIGDSTYTQTGIFETMLSSMDGCDSTVVLDLIVLPILTENLVNEICDGESVMVGDSIYTVSGMYTNVLTSVVTGCDSIVNLDLTVIPIAQTMLVEAICQGETFEVGAQSFNTTGQYTVILSSVVSNCDSVVMLDLQVNPVFEVQLTEEICSDETFEVGNESFNTTGDFVINLMTAEGCDSTVLLNLTVAPCALNFTSESITAGCNGAATGSFNFQMTIGTPPYTYTWTGLNQGMNGNNIINQNNMQATVDNLLADTYTIVVTDANNVMIDFDITVDEPAALVLNFEALQYGTFNTSCPGMADGQLTAIVQNGTLPYTFAWSNGMTTATITGLAADTYSLTFTDANGCHQEDEFTLIAPPEISAALSAVDPVCFGDQTGIISVNDAAGGLQPYLYAIDDGGFSSNPVFSNLAVGEHNVQVQDANGCEWTEQITINAAEELTVEIIGETELSFGDSISLFAQTSYPVQSYIWKGERLFPCAGTDTLDCPRPFIAPLESGNYTVTVIDENGCTASDQITIIIKKPRDVFIPTAFSPDGDGINDVLMINAGPNVSNIKSFFIYDRWGNQLFEQENFEPNSPTSGWDGTYRGQLMNPAVYVYFAEIEYIDGEIILFSGDFVLLR